MKIKEKSHTRKTDQVLHDKIYEFHRRGVLRKLGGRVTRKSSGNSVKGLVETTFTPVELVAKYDGKCYLTGRVIDINDKSSYQLDHIIPASSGGESSLNNCGLSCKQANWAKGDMSTEEFFQLCLDVVKYNDLK